MYSTRTRKQVVLLDNNFTVQCHNMYAPTRNSNIKKILKFESILILCCTPFFFLQCFDVLIQRFFCNSRIRHTHHPHMMYKYDNGGIEDGGNVSANIDSHGKKMQPISAHQFNHVTRRILVDKQNYLK